MRPWPALAAALPALTCSEPSLDLTLDAGRRCTQIAIEVLDDAVLPGWQVHDLVVLDDSGEQAWALATDPDKRLQLTGWPEGPAIDLTELADAGVLALEPGPAPGEAWLFHDAPAGARVWRLGDASRGEMTEAPDLGAFPEGDTAWTRRLLFVGGVPHVLAAPTSADASTLALPLARLDRETLAVVDTWSIEFWWTCEEPPELEGAGCIESPYESIAEIELLATTQADGSSESVALIGLHAFEASETPELEGLHHTIVSSLELRDDGPGVPPSAFRRDQLGWIDIVPLVISPAFVASDDDGLYVLAGSIQPPDTTLPALQKDFLVRAETNGQSEGINSIFAQVDKELRSHLLQIGGQVALGQFLEGEWRVAPIIEVDGRPAIDPELRAGVAVPDDTVTRGAGHGQVLLRPPSGPAQRVTLACVAADGDEETP